MTASLEGNANYVFIPDSPIIQFGSPYKFGAVTVLIDEDMNGTDSLFHENQFDLQWNFFNSPPPNTNPSWWQIIVQPSEMGIGTFANHFQCVLPDTIMLGDNKQIAELIPTDKTLSQKGRLSTVLQTMNRPFKGNLVSVKARGMLPIKATPEHPILVVTAETGKTRIRFSEPYWKPISNVKPKKMKQRGDYLLMPILQGEVDANELSLTAFIRHYRGRAKVVKRTSLPLNVETAWLIGLYVAEGSANPEKGTFFLSMHADKDIEHIEKAKKIIGDLGYSNRSSWLSKTGKCRTIVVPSQVFARAMVHWCGRGARNKQIPDFILLHKNLEILESFLDGYGAGDGCQFRDHNGKLVNAMKTVSRTLAQQLQLAYARLHKVARVTASKRRKYSYPAYQVALNSDGSDTSRFINGYMVSPVLAKIDEPYNGVVCNVETTDNTYLVSNAVVHNCWLVKATAPNQPPGAVSLGGDSYWVTSFSIGDWAKALFKAGSSARMGWAASSNGKVDRIYEAFLQIRRSDGISNSWILDPSNLAPFETDLELSDQTTFPNGGANHVFSITGSDNGSLYNASSGKGRIFYEGEHLSSTAFPLIGTYTAESSLYRYALWSAHLQNGQLFSL